MLQRFLVRLAQGICVRNFLGGPLEARKFRAREARGWIGADPRERCWAYRACERVAGYWGHVKRQLPYRGFWGPSLHNFRNQQWLDSRRAEASRASTEQRLNLRSYRGHVQARLEQGVHFAERYAFFL